MGLLIELDFDLRLACFGSSTAEMGLRNEGSGCYRKPLEEEMGVSLGNTTWFFVVAGKEQ